MFIRSITDGSQGAVCVTLADEETGGCERLIISSKLWNAAKGSLELLSEVGEEEYDRLKSAAEKTSALRSSSRMIGFGEKSKRDIKRRLRAQGIGDDAADWAVRVLEKNGYLNEADSCARIAQSAVASKHYGRRRVLDYLLSHGYDRDAATSAADSIPDEEYRAALRYNLEHKFPHAAESDYKERQKMMASLARLGFSSGEIGDALSEMHEEKDR